MILRQVLFFVAVAVSLAGCSSSRTVTKLRTTTEVVTPKTVVGPKKRVAVVEFQDKSHFGQRRLGQAASDIMATALGETGRFLMIERERLDKVLEELKLQESGLMEEKSVSEFGHFLGANAIIVGVISNYGERTEAKDNVLYQTKTQRANCTVEVRVIDVATGVVLYTSSGEGEATRKDTGVLGGGVRGGYDETLAGESLRSAINKMTEGLAAKIDESDWSCFIADVVGTDIYLTAGKLSSVSTGLRLECYRTGREIKDPGSGRVLGTALTPLGSTLEVTGYFGDDGSIAKLVEGESPAKGDMCKLGRAGR